MLIAEVYPSVCPIIGQRVIPVCRVDPVDGYVEGFKHQVVGDAESAEAMSLAGSHFGDIHPNCVIVLEIVELVYGGI